MSSTVDDNVCHMGVSICDMYRFTRCGLSLKIFQNISTFIFNADIITTGSGGYQNRILKFTTFYSFYKGISGSEILGKLCPADKLAARPIAPSTQKKPQGADKGQGRVPSRDPRVLAFFFGFPWFSVRFSWLFERISESGLLKRCS